jgi:hypothetical protein
LNFKKEFIDIKTNENKQQVLDWKKTWACKPVKLEVIVPYLLLESAEGLTCLETGEQEVLVFCTRRQGKWFSAL